MSHLWFSQCLTVMWEYKASNNTPVSLGFTTCKCINGKEQGAGEAIADASEQTHSTLQTEYGGMAWYEG